jgi:chlorite dismutase
MIYTGTAMYNFAYAHRVLQEPGPAMPNGFLVPMSKTADWWAKDWMERHTFFLPRYDQSGTMLAEGHALAAQAGIGCVMRRFYQHEALPAAAGDYDFVTYFECADADVPAFHEVCAALRDVTRNPEWAYVREGPTWAGRRVATWPELFR